MVLGGCDLWWADSGGFASGGVGGGVFFFFFWLWLVVVSGCGYAGGGEEVNFIFSI